MDLRQMLIESGDHKKRRSIKNVVISVAAHAALLAAAIGLTVSTSHKAAAEDKPITAFVQSAGAAPPPPPPPPPPARSSGATQPVVKPVVTPVTPTPSFVQPTEVPKEVPKVETTQVPTQSTNASETPSTLGESTPLPSSAPAGVPGGVEGGVEGGQVGGEIGGVVGGVIGGTVGGTGKTLGGTGTGDGQGDGSGDAKPVAPATPSGPLRVGGDVKAPIVTQRVKPQYTAIARSARVTGVVIVEAVIDRHGNVDRVKVVRGLPMGLSESAEAAVRQWKFKPGTLGGQPIDVIFNLTVVFKMDGASGADAEPAAGE